MKRPAWAASTVARRWLAVAAVLLLFLAGRSATRSFGAETVLSDGARAYATCKGPWRSARAARPSERFTLWVMTGGTGTRRAEGVAKLGVKCRREARQRLLFSGSLLAAGALCTWLAWPARRGLRPGAGGPPPSEPGFGDP